MECVVTERIAAGIGCVAPGNVEAVVSVWQEQDGPAHADQPVGAVGQVQEVSGVRSGSGCF